MITIYQKLLIYACGLLAGYLFTWPIALLMIFFFADRCGEFPIRRTQE